MPLPPYPLRIAATIGLSLTVPSQAAGEPAATSQHNNTWHVRAGVSLNPAINLDDTLPTAHLGFGGSLSGFLHLSESISAGLGFDWDKYTFDSKNHGDPPGAEARYVDEVLTQTRLMALFQWGVLERRLITPFIVAGLGYGWQHTKLTEWQCDPELASGPTLAAGVGLDFAVHEWVGVGVEYRINTLPYSSRTCTFAQIDEEPMGPPQDALWQRIALTVSVRH